MNGEHEDIVRMRLRLEGADQSLKNAIADDLQTKIELAKEKTQYFEKLAFGSGAAIAAIVSFLGGHTGRLEPVWILRSSLISLVVAMVAALYRNFRYPNYVLAVKVRICIEATRLQQLAKNELLQVDRGVISWQSGEPIDIKKWNERFGESDEAFNKLIRERFKEENRLVAEWTLAENICIASICIAMISLVWLALRNF